jgi:hypothetical protein
MPVSKESSTDRQYNFADVSASSVPSLTKQPSLPRSFRMKQTFDLTQPTNRIIEETDDFSQKSFAKEIKHMTRNTRISISNLETNKCDSSLNNSTKKSLIDKLDGGKDGYNSNITKIQWQLNKLNTKVKNTQNIQKRSSFNNRKSSLGNID